jgi:hypothetical protein
MSDNFNYFLFNIFDWSWHLNIMIDNLFDFDCSNFFNNDGISNFHDNWNSSFYDLNYGFLNNFRHLYNSFMNNWHLNNSIDFLVNLFDNCNDSIDYFLHLFDSILNDNFFLNNNDFIRLSNSVGYCHNLLHDLWNLHDSFLNLNNRDWLVNDSVDDYVSNFNMIFNFFCISILDLWHNDFFYPLDFDNLGNLYYFFHYFFHNNLNFNNSVDYFFSRDNLLSSFLYLFYFIRNVIDNLLYRNNTINFHYFLNEFLDLNNPWDLFCYFDNSLNNSWDFDNSINDFLDLNNFFDDIIDYDWNFYWNWYFFLNFSNFFNLDNLFSDNFDSDNLRNFDDSINYFLHDFFNLNNF